MSERVEDAQSFTGFALRGLGRRASDMGILISYIRNRMRPTAPNAVQRPLSRRLQCELSPLN